MSFTYTVFSLQLLLTLLLLEPLPAVIVFFTVITDLCCCRSSGVIGYQKKSTLALALCYGTERLVLFSM